MLKVYVAFVSFVILSLVILSEAETGTVQDTSLTVSQTPVLEANQNTLAVSQLEASPEVVNVLENEFCSVQICGNLDWRQWIIVSPDQPWEADELMVVSNILNTVIPSLDAEGLDGRKLLSGYRFRRQHGEYISGHEGRIAVVNHTDQVISLADAAFKRLHGFYIIHELGHIVDLRTSRQLSANYHALAGSDYKTGRTANGYWLNRNAEEDLEEATADAFALWIMASYDKGYKPVFAYTPRSSDYGLIEDSILVSLGSISAAQ